MDTKLTLSRPDLFDREDESDDALFYAQPRLVAHIDPSTIDSLTQVYRELLPEDGIILDLMSSWISHLPPDMRFGRVFGLGMNEAELAENDRLDEFVTQNLNQTSELPFPDHQFDAIINAVSLQYLNNPVDVFRSAARTLKPGGLHLIALSHRCFPTKAIKAFRMLDPMGRVQLVQTYFENAGQYESAVFLDRSPSAGDPLWIIMARKSS